MNKKYILVFWFGTLFFAIGYAFIQVKRENMRLDERVADAGGVQEELPIFGHVPDFEFVTSDGELLRKQDLQGQVWLVDLFYTRCNRPCMMMSHNFSRFQRFFGNLDQFKLISISIDREHDTDEVLNSYRSDYHGKQNIWKFVAPEPEALKSFAESMKLPLDLEEKTHSSRFVLIDQNGNIRGYYDSLQKTSMELLRANVSQLVTQS